MTVHYTTPRELEGTLKWHLRRAGFENATTIGTTRYVYENGEACLKTSVNKYATVLMALETLQGYERALRELPGVVRTEIIHKDARKFPLRDQVIVIHRRMWEEPLTLNQVFSLTGKTEHLMPGELTAVTASRGAVPAAGHAASTAGPRT